MIHARALVVFACVGVFVAAGCNAPQRPRVDAFSGLDAFALGDVASPDQGLSPDSSRSDMGVDSGTVVLPDMATVDAATTTPDMGAPVDVGTDAFASADVGLDAATIDTATIDTNTHDAGNDANDDASFMTTCNATGRVGAHCRTGACVGGATCDQFAPLTIQAAFGLRQGAPDPRHTGYAVIESPAIASQSAPFNGAEGTLCAQSCDLASTTNTCGTCAHCSGQLTQAPIVASFGGARDLFGAMPPFGANTGVCRLDCTWAPTERGYGCPDMQMTCDPFSGTCAESCTSDNECNTAYGATYAGELVTELATSAPATCNAATGRCGWAGTTGATVATRCTTSADCAPGIGVCLNGGMCAEFGCSPAGMICVGGPGGVCLQTNVAGTSTLCLAGCSSAAACAPGNACQLFPGGAAIGPFRGYCLATCRADTDCRASETCTDTLDAMGASVAGTCVPRCTSVGGIGAASGGCASSEWCIADHAGATYGRCLTTDSFCGTVGTMSLSAASTECPIGQVCDETLATPHDAIGAVARETFGDGHCAPACTVGGCTGGATCVTSGPLRGLCRMPCTTPTGCPIDQTCDTTLGECVEVMTPP